VAADNANVKKPRPPRLLRSVRYLEPVYLLAAVLEVLRDNQTAAAVQRFDAAAEEWFLHDDMRHDLCRRAEQAWCRLTGLDFTWFPFREDCVVRLYFRLVRQTPATLRAWREEIEEGVAHAATRTQVPDDGPGSGPS